MSDTEQIKEKKDLLTEARFPPFLAPYEQNRVRAKYENVPFMELFNALKANDNDAILFVMDKYDPLLNSIWMNWFKAIQSNKQTGDFGAMLRVEDWKNDAFLYLSGAGMVQPFFDKYKIPEGSPSEEHLWRNFSMYLKYYLKYYFSRLIHKEAKQRVAISSLSKDIYTSEGPEERVATVKAKPISNNEVINTLFEKYLFLLKNYAERHKKRGKTMYKAISLRVKGVPFKEIAEILGMSLSAMYKAVSRAKKKWLKFLEAHKTTGETPEQLEKKENPGNNPIKE